MKIIGNVLTTLINAIATLAVLYMLGTCIKEDSCRGQCKDKSYEYKWGSCKCL
jgi:hypothetical protein